LEPQFAFPSGASIFWRRPCLYAALKCNKASCKKKWSATLFTGTQLLCLNDLSVITSVNSTYVHHPCKDYIGTCFGHKYNSDNTLILHICRRTTCRNMSIVICVFYQVCMPHIVPQHLELRVCLLEEQMSIIVI